MSNKIQENFELYVEEIAKELKGIYFKTTNQELVESYQTDDVESPIEVLMLMALKRHSIIAREQGINPVINTQGVFHVEGRKMRVDFLLTFPQNFTVKNKYFNREVKMIIECDGHDFHEKTKEQAQKDKSRDRILKASGYTVFRFTGSEIYRNAAGCAREIFNYAENELNQKGFNITEF